MTKVLDGADRRAGGSSGGPAPSIGGDPRGDDPGREPSRARPSERLDFGQSPWRGAFKAAGRHSARVRFLRRATFGGSAIVITLILGVALFDPFRRLPANISIGQVTLDGTKITVDSPKITGVQKDGRPFEVKARSGLQDTTTPDVVELLDIDAKIGAADASTVQVTASHGLYDGVGDTMALQGDVRIWNDAGYDIRAKTAKMDFKTGVLGSDQPVNVILNAGTIAANRMDIRDNGGKVSFEGDVKSMIHAASAETQAAPEPVDPRR